MVRILESGWGDWWLVRDGVAVAVHVFSGSPARTRAAAEREAADRFPGDRVLVQPLTTR